MLTVSWSRSIPQCKYLNRLPGFDPSSVFRVLYKDILHRLIDNGVISFEESTDVILRTGFINGVEKYLKEYFRQYSYKHGRSSAEIHRENLERFQDQWSDIRSDSVCFPCLRRRPEYNFAMWPLRLPNLRGEFRRADHRRSMGVQGSSVFLMSDGDVRGRDSENTSSYYWSRSHLPRRWRCTWRRTSGFYETNTGSDRIADFISKILQGCFWSKFRSVDSTRPEILC